jgi:hypothetical protein
MKKSSPITAEQLCERLGLDPKQFLPPKPPSPPRFNPVPVELEPGPPVERPRRIFEALVGDVRTLFDDFLSSPQKYPEGTEELLSNILNKSPSDRTPEELDGLDALTVVFASQAPPLDVPRSLQRKEPPDREALLEAAEEVSAAMDNPFWWL